MLEFLRDYQVLIVFALGFILAGCGIILRSRIHVEVDQKIDVAGSQVIKDMELFTKRLDGHSQRLDGHADRLNRGDARFDDLTKQIASLPTARDITDLKLVISELKGEAKLLGQKVEGVGDLHERLEKQVSVIDDWLRNNARA